MKATITVQEVLERTITVDIPADTSLEKFAWQCYQNEQIVLDSNDLTVSTLQIETENQKVEIDLI